MESLQPNTSPKSQVSAYAALITLALIGLLAFAGTTRPGLADQFTLAILGVCFLVCLLPPIYAWLDGRTDAATFALSAAFFIVYGLARRAGPSDGFALTLAIMLEAPVVIPWSGYIVALGIAVSLGTSRTKLSPYARAFVVVSLVLALLGIGSFILLGRFYPIGITSMVDPEYLIYLLIQLLEYTAVALLCNAVAACKTSRRLALRAIPFLLLALWARHHYDPMLLNDED